MGLMCNTIGGYQEDVRPQGGEVAQDYEEAGKASWHTAGEYSCFGVWDRTGFQI